MAFHSDIHADKQCADRSLGRWSKLVVPLTDSALRELQSKGRSGALAMMHQLYIDEVVAVVVSNSLSRDGSTIVGHSAHLTVRESCTYGGSSQ